MDAFDNISEEVVPMVLDSKGRVMPNKHDKVALIDADTLVFQVCVTTEEKIQVLPPDFYTKQQWEEIINNPTFDGDYYAVMDMELAQQKIDSKIQDILLHTGCQTVELHFSSGSENFRYKMYPRYKANRDRSAVPYSIADLRKVVADKYTAEVHTAIEADDAVVAKYKAFPDKYVLVAVDKDVLYSVPGKHWNYYEAARFNIEAKWVEVDEVTALKHQFMQTLTGDRTDNVITGLKRVGKKTAEKILADVTTKSQAWRKVLDTYKSQGKSAREARSVLYLVSMHLVCYKDGKYHLSDKVKDFYENQ